ncbi:MAG: hypothetical protein NTV46_03845 [Verrucomicrobia bacterium]|nr:hypothetical protein [Verrucomicrobiota bacterium]
MKSPRKDRHQPSPHEKCQKIEQAIKAIEAGAIAIIAERHNQLAMDFLEADDMGEVLDWVAVFLEEIRAIGPIQCFVGQFAESCTEPGYRDIYLFPYHWYSHSFGERVYLKFGIKTVKGLDGRTHTYYYHLDCHEDKP